MNRSVTESPCHGAGLPFFCVGACTLRVTRWWLRVATRWIDATPRFANLARPNGGRVATRSHLFASARTALASVQKQPSRVARCGWAYGKHVWVVVRFCGLSKLSPQQLVGFRPTPNDLFGRRLLPRSLAPLGTPPENSGGSQAAGLPSLPSRATPYTRAYRPKARDARLRAGR